MLHLDFVSMSTDVELIGITANKGEEQTEIDLLRSSKKVVDGEICYDIWISEASAHCMQEADEIVIALSEDTEITGYGLSINGEEVKPAVVFEQAEYIDISLPLSVCGSIRRDGTVKTCDMDEKIVFQHDILSDRNRRHRRGNALYWRKDRNLSNRYPFVDRKFSKRRLHKMNRKDPDICSSTYYKTGYSLNDICYGLT